MSNVWTPRTTDEEPKTKLTHWRVYSVPTKGDHPTLHFVGNAGYEGRVSSPIVSYDPKIKQGVSSSGRVYELYGNPGYNSNAMHVWGAWLSLCGIEKYDDYTPKYSKEFK